MAPSFHLVNKILLLPALADGWFQPVPAMYAIAVAASLIDDGGWRRRSIQTLLLADVTLYARAIVALILTTVLFALSESPSKMAGSMI